MIGNWIRLKIKNLLLKYTIKRVKWKMHSRKIFLKCITNKELKFNIHKECFSRHSYASPSCAEQE